MNKIVTTLLVSSLTLGGFAVVHADSDEYEKRERHGKYCDKHGKKSGSRGEYMIERLDLSNDQAKQVRSIRDNYRPKMESLRDKMKDKRQQLRKSMHEDTINQNQINELAKKIGDLKTEKIILRSEMRIKIHKVLNKEQREKMKNLKGRHEHGYKYKHHD